MPNGQPIDANQALLDRQEKKGDVRFVNLDERGWAYPPCGRPIWWGEQLMGRCEARGTWAVDVAGTQRLYCTGHAHSTLVFVDAFAESERYAARQSAAQAQAKLEKNTPQFQAPEN